jgi:hypothetical protein
MGVRGLMKLLRENCPSSVTIVPVPKMSTVALDFGTLVHQAIKRPCNVETAIDSDWEFGGSEHTGFIGACMAAFAGQFAHAIWVVDNNVPNPAKVHEHARRTVASARSAVLLLEKQTLLATNDPGQRLATEVCQGSIEFADAISVRRRELQVSSFQSQRITADIMARIYTHLDNVVMAPVGTEAEKLAALLSIEGKVDHVVSDDTDTLAFGASSMLCKYTGGHFTHVDLGLALEELELTMHQFQDLCILMGCDFTERTLKGIGPVGALKLIRMHSSIEGILANRLDGAPGFDYVHARLQFSHSSAL